MIWLAIGLGLIALILLFIGGFARWVGAGCGVLAALSLALSLIVVVDTGHVGVKTLFGAVQPGHFEEGLHIKHPFVAVSEMSVRTHDYSMTTTQGGDAVAALSLDGMRMPLDISVMYKLVADDAPWVYQKFGEAYWHKILRPASRTAVREAVSMYNAQDAYSTKREEMADRMGELLKTRIAAMVRDWGHDGEAIEIQQVMVRNVDLPPKVKDAIEEKLQAEQDAQRMDFVLEKERKEAKRKVIEASGIKKFQDIVREGIDEQLLRWKGIEATMKIAESPNSKVVVIGGKDGMPLILNSK